MELSFSPSIIAPKVLEEIKRGDEIDVKTLFSPVIMLVIGCKLASMLIRLAWLKFVGLLSLFMNTNTEAIIKQKTSPLGLFIKSLIVPLIEISLNLMISI